VGFRGWLKKKETYWERTTVTYCKLYICVKELEAACGIYRLVKEKGNILAEDKY